ncbi:ankyrin [Fusarium pseudocircinatum]|uniref:Ankyrin n=1 Tax=Fusarium pseudocircinatum TaxID=56676 RepID=A0A8H5P6S9_9HYPO|nr:ankyrin [Fusarium pseudocircinatum]
MPPTPTEDRSPYANFVQGPNEYHDGEEPPYIPMIMADRNRYVLCETDQFDLLLEIIGRDDVTTLKQYLDIAPWTIDENQELPRYYSFFYTAVSNGSLGALKTLLSHHEKVIGPNQKITFRERGFTLLNEAARRGHLEIVEFLLNNQPLYADIHKRDYTGCTAIAAASDLYSTRYIEAFNWQPSVDKSKAVMNLLLDWDACATDMVVLAHQDPSWKPETVLSMASEWAGAEMIECLIGGGADVHARFTKDSLQLQLYDEQDHIVHNVTAIHMASFRGNFVALETLLTHHVDAIIVIKMVSSCDSRGATPLHWATRNNLFNSNLHETAHNVRTTIDLILKKNPTMVNIRDVEGNTALHYAARYFDAGIRDDQGETPLHNIFAIVDGTIDEQIISLLLANGAKINDIDHAGNTPLHIAARRLDHHDAIAFLIEQGADTTIGISNNDIPAHIAASGNVSILGLAEKVEIQDGVLATLTNAGGDGLMDLANAEGKTPRQICKAQRDKWREDEDRELVLARATSFASGDLWPYDRYHGHHDAGFVTNPSRLPSPESFGEPADYFVQWLGNQSPGTKAKASYLPFNTMGIPTNTRPGVDPEELFAGGDPRINENWLLLGMHTLLLRDHNRLCDILRKQKPTWDDEQLYRNPLVIKNGKPMTVSAKMAVVYRFHEFIIPSFPIKNHNNETLWEQNLFKTSFNSTGFLDVGLERILAGAPSSHIPNFKSRVDESFRSTRLYRGRPFDIVVSSIVHEREQGLPAFNQYFRAYNAQDPDVVVPIRDAWDNFSTDPEVIQNLEKLYKHPDDVDLVVGCQLDEEFFPGTTVPKSALIISLFSLFGMGNSDRFSIGFAMMRCLLVDRPRDCHPSNALEDLIWERKDLPGFPNFRFYSDFWVKELDLPAHVIRLDGGMS